MKIMALRRVARNVEDLASATAFYKTALGFHIIGPAMDDPALAACLGVRHVTIQRLALGDQEIELSKCDPPGAAYPKDTDAHDLNFQHIAIVTTDIADSYERIMGQGAQPITRGGPQALPESSGGVTAFKFRDPSGHPLELLAFPIRPNTAVRKPGYDHSAISVSNLADSLAFYTGLGLHLAAQQINQGPEQESLDGLDHVIVDVAALHPPHPSPHLELLHYRRPLPKPTKIPALNDIAADRLIFGAATQSPVLLRDPDGHILLLDNRSSA